MGQCDWFAIFGVVCVLRIPKIRKESEEFWREAVDWCEAVDPGPNQAEDLESVLLQNVDLKFDVGQSRLYVSILSVRLTSALFAVILRGRILVL